MKLLNTVARKSMGGVCTMLLLGGGLLVAQDPYQNRYPYPNQQAPYPNQQAPYPDQQAQYPDQQSPYPDQQGAYQQQGPQQGQVLSPDQLDNLVAPIALYPDP